MKMNKQKNSFFGLRRLGVQQ